MNDLAAAPAKDAPVAPPSCRSYRYWDGLVGGSTPCWRLTDVGVCLQQTKHDIGLCSQHLEEAKDW